MFPQEKMFLNQAYRITQFSSNLHDGTFNRQRVGSHCEIRKTTNHQ